MKILINNKFKNGFLDYHLGPKEFRIKVIGFKNLQKLEDVYYIRPKSIKLVLNYLKKIGPVAVIRKISSRMRERFRNEKYISLGFGEIIESIDKQIFPSGKIIAFLAPFHPALTERIVLPQELIFEISNFDIPEISQNSIAYQPLENQKIQPNNWWRDLNGWSIYSGKKITENQKEMISQEVIKNIKNTDWQKTNIIKFQKSEISETKTDKQKSTSKEIGVLFGFGNYAKTIILPNVKKYINIEKIHEIDPTQIYFEKNISLDTSPVPRQQEKYGVYFIAGFHHTHAPLAIHALSQNSHAVVEKPVVVNKEQLKKLVQIMEKSSASLFSGFHKRYSPFNNLVFKDLKINLGEPISYHAIAYELPQPSLFWYNWPNSKSPLVANGCHWIDHFLYLNNFSEPKSYDVFLAQNDSINVSVELKNGAFFTMVLADKGSPALGVQDYVELRAKQSTIKIIDDATYIAQDKFGIIRNKKINKMKNYACMYSQISKKIYNREKGDSIKSIEASSGLILSLEEKLQFLLQNRSK